MHIKEASTKVMQLNTSPQQSGTNFCCYCGCYFPTFHLLWNSLCAKTEKTSPAQDQTDDITLFYEPH